jgi:anti-anti-sigma factor
MGDRFSVQSDHVGDVALLSVEGAADLATVPDFAEHLWRVVDAGEGRIVIDLSATQFIDSRMIELLLSAAERVKRLDGAIAICCGTSSVNQVLELCGVSRVVPVHASREEAIQELG